MASASGPGGRGTVPKRCSHPAKPDDVARGFLQSARPSDARVRSQPSRSASGPSGCVCQACERRLKRDGGAGDARGIASLETGESIRTVPVHDLMAGPLLDGCEPLRLISIFRFLFLNVLLAGFYFTNRNPNRTYRAGSFFPAIRPYQMPDAMKTALHPAQNQIRNGDGR